MLLIEDDETTRGMMRAMLEREGWQVTEASNGREGLERVAESRAQRHSAGPHDAGDGWLRVHRRSCAPRPEWSDIPVVVITAKELTPEDRAAAERIGGKGAAEGRVLAGGAVK